MTPDQLRAIAEDFLIFCSTFGIDLFDWQREAFGEALRRENGKFVHRVIGISVTRGDGKSYGGAATGSWRLLCGPGKQHVLSAALDTEGSKVVLDHGRTILRRHTDLIGSIEERADSLLVPMTGSRWTITSRDHTSSRGLHPDIIIYDEVGWARDDELFASLLAGQASCADPLMLVISTVGRQKSGPLWRIKEMAEAGVPGVFWWYSDRNRSPKVTADFLAKQKRLLLPGQYAREHENSWTDHADAFTCAADVDFCMSQGWTQQLTGQAERRYVYFIDFGTVHDPTVIGIGHAAGERVFIDHLTTVQGSKESPVQIAGVVQLVKDLATRFPPRLIRVESWQGVSAVQALQTVGLPVELFAPTAKAHSEEWPVLAQRLSSRTLVLPRHERLREELLGLSYEVTAFGVRVTDRGKVHQDHAVAVRGVVAGLAGPVLPPLMFRSGGKTISSAPTPPLLDRIGETVGGVLAAGMAQVKAVVSTVQQTVNPPPEKLPFPTNDGHVRSLEEIASLAPGCRSREEQQRLDQHYEKQRRRNIEFEQMVKARGLIGWFPGEGVQGVRAPFDSETVEAIRQQFEQWR